MLAAKSGHEPVIRLLLGEPHINTETKSTEDGHTAASLALAQGHTGIVELLEEFESRRAGSDLRDLDLVAVMGQDASASGEHGVRESGNPLVEESGGPVVESGEPVSEKSREPVVKEEEQPVVEDSGEAAVEASRAPTMEGSGEPVAEDAGQPIVRESGQPVLEDSGGPVVQDSRELAVEQSREPVAKESGNPLVKEVGNVESDGTNTRGTGRATPLPRWRSFLKTVFRCC
ncbi:hypothetical protein BKA70DRAFT_1275358 [Coprinopsis sp. MPI-PUGE-AT-0042]|nr:hypothetical protein BKA70DRAFT_1275358 [Coprinopsis sp. MPI-PUGE-AT-0042]